MATVHILPLWLAGVTLQLLLLVCSGRSLDAMPGRRCCESDNATISSIFDSSTNVTLASRNVTLSVATRIVHNKKAPLVFIHGLLGSKQVWRPLLTEPALRSVLCERSVVLLDLRGFGDSQKDVPNTTFRLAENALDIIALLDELQLNYPAIFVGHSLGGFITQQIITSFPDRTAKAVVFSSGVSFESYASSPAAAQLVPLLASFTDVLPQQFLEALIDAFYVDPAPADYRALLLDAASKGTLDAVKYSLSEVFDFTPQLQSMRIPTLLAWGVLDHIFPAEPFRGAMSQAICGSTTVTIGPSNSHYVIQDAATQLSSALAKFVKSDTYVCEGF